jgi:hypothetical protein
LTIFSHTISSDRFGGILLHADRFKHINNVARILLPETGLGQKVATAQHGEVYYDIV